MEAERRKKVEELFEAARQQPADGRAEFLRQACRGDPKLCAEVESLLNAAEADAPLLDGSPLPTLKPGDTLGSFEIRGMIGRGGMGEVYRARDPRLNRDVAIKISMESFSDRFGREARAIAALNHPNICTLYDVGSNYLVMELIEGEPPKGPLPLEEALRISRQIAEALEAAHEKGIVHRDLKPGNVKVKPDGSVKVMDFGLAKRLETASGDPETSPTMTISPTRAGLILGTAAYMAPEQARGKTVDKRADIWAFGVLLYELLTGRRPFHGEDTTEILAAVMKEEPQWDAVPPQVQRLLKVCLEKDPKKRLRDIGDAWKLLEDTPTAQGSGGASHRLLWPAFVTVSVLLAGLAAWGWLHTTPPSPRPVERWTIPLESTSTNAPMVALSRDGTRLAYVAGTDTSPHLMLRMMDQFEAKPIPVGSLASAPVFSPDGQWVVYTAIDRPPPFSLKKIPVAGGTPITLCDGNTELGASWGDDDTIFFTGFWLSGGSGLHRVAAAGGAPQTLTSPDAKKGETGHAYPQLLPGGQAVLFTVFDSAGASQIAVLDLKRGSYRILVKAGSNARYVPTGHLVYARGGTLFAVPFDVKRMAVTGAETPVVEGVASSLFSADFAVADSGLLVYRQGGDLRSSLLWADRSGQRQPVKVPPQYYSPPVVSPDGERTAVAICGDPSPICSAISDIWIVDLARGASLRLTYEGSNSAPVWTPDGRRVTFASRRVANSGIYWAPADGSGKPELLLATETGVSPTAWTPDGQTLLYTQLDPGGKSHIWMLSAPGRGGEGKPRPFIESPSNQINVTFSPDGRWVAYDSDETVLGRFEVYVRPFPGPGGKTLISTGGGIFPRWRGREIFFDGLDEPTVAAVEVQTSPALHAGPQQNLFKLTNKRMWDVAPDGKRVLLVERASTPADGGKLVAVVNWFEELRRLVPATSK